MLRRTWEDVAYRWNEYESPLRPHPQDIQILRDILAKHHFVKANVFLCGVTPEIAAMDWPFPVELVAMDQAERMVQLVWPVDVPGVRRAVVGNWLESGLPAHSQDIVIGDGGFVFFDYPAGQRQLLNAMHNLLRPGGLFVYRHYAQLHQPEPLSHVLDEMRAGRIGNFHIFKWRVAMAMQTSSAAGVVQDDIWQVIVSAGLDKARLPRTGWSAGAINTIHFYRGKTSRLYFPTRDEFASLMKECFAEIRHILPSYELGERCPVFSALAYTPPPT